MTNHRDDNLAYAGFWSRLGAIFVDFLVFVPLAALDFWLDRTSRTYALSSLFPYFLSAHFYSIYFHARWGQTLGKMAVGIRVVKLDGGSISWLQAFLRSSVDIVLGFLMLLFYANALSSIPVAEYHVLEFRERSQRIAELSKPWGWLDWLQNIWIWSEIVVILFNNKRRALHDFLAGTVVIRVQKADEPKEIPATLP